MQLGDLGLFLHESLELVGLLDLIVEIGFHGAEIGSHLTDAATDVVRHHWQILGTNHQQGNHTNHYQLTEADIEHSNRAAALRLVLALACLTLKDTTTALLHLEPRLLIH